MTELKDLTPGFRHVRLLLAREKDHPEGERDEGYDLLVPLDAEGRLDAAEWKTHQALCRVRHFRTDIADYPGLTIETVSRVFSKLREKGIIRLH